MARGLRKIINVLLYGVDAHNCHCHLNQSLLWFFLLLMLSYLDALIALRVKVLEGVE
jgi:hypothetical protein